MTVRNDISIRWEVSPRLAEIGAGSSELTVQDSHDTLSYLEDHPLNMDDPHLVSTAGKEDLGGGVSVGLTSTLQNVQYAFARTAPRCSGTVTTADTAGEYLNDSSATFQTDNVARGDWVINFTDQSVTEVVTVVSQTQLYCRVLSNGTDNQFGLNDAYKVWEVSEAAFTGGNLVALDDVGGSITPVFPTFGRFISKTAASSATTADLEAIQYASYNNGVTIDVTNGAAGTNYPRGTYEHPVNNITDAKAIAAARGFTRLYFVENSSTIGASDDVSNYLVEGRYHDRTVITLTTGCTITDVQFNNASIQGDAGSDFCVLENCSLRTIDNFNGNVYRSELGGTISLNLGAFRHWVRCTSNQNTGIPILDFQSTTQNLIMTGYTGDLKIRNFTGGSLEIYCDSANIELESNCTGGTISLYGVGGLVDNSAGTTVDDSAYTSAIAGQLLNIEGMTDHVHMMRLITAAVCNKLLYVDNGDGTYTATYRDMADSKDRMTQTGPLQPGGRATVNWDMS